MDKHETAHFMVLMNRKHGRRMEMGYKMKSHPLIFRVPRVGEATLDRGSENENIVTQSQISVGLSFMLVYEKHLYLNMSV